MKTDDMRYIESELLPMLRERGDYRDRIDRQLAQWRGGRGVCSLLLSVDDVPEADRLPVYDNEGIHFDPYKMFVNGLRDALKTALAPGDAVPSMRANVGCGAFCSMLGGLEQTYYPDKMPWLTRHLTHDTLAAMTANDITLSDEMARGLEQMEYMSEILEGTGIELFPMDLQGPLDIAHLLEGDDFFYELYDDPDFADHLMALAVELDTFGMEKNLEIIKPTDHVCHYNGLVLPAEKPLKVSDDTSTIIGGEHIRRFSVRYNEMLLARFGGGYMHYCGENPALFETCLKTQGSVGLNLGNPEKHDCETVLKALRENGMCYFGEFPVSMCDMVKHASGEDGTFNIFLRTHCKRADAERLVDEFNEAVFKLTK